MTIVLWALSLAPLASWITALLLLRFALQPPAIRFLTAVTGAALMGALGSTLLLPLALARLANLTVPEAVPGLLLTLAVLLFSLPGPGFLALYLLGWFRVDHES